MSRSCYANQIEAFDFPPAPQHEAQSWELSGNLEQMLEDILDEEEENEEQYSIREEGPDDDIAMSDVEPALENLSLVAEPPPPLPPSLIACSPPLS